jgi:hypothetical protein
MRYAHLYYTIVQFLTSTAPHCKRSNRTFSPFDSKCIHPALTLETLIFIGDTEVSMLVFLDTGKDNGGLSLDLTSVQLRLTSELGAEVFTYYSFVLAADPGRHRAVQ